MSRPVPTLDELKAIREKSQILTASAFLVEANVTFRYGSASAENVKISGVSEQYDQIKRFEIQQGRYFTEAEMQAGRGVAVIGATVAENLFGSLNPIGKNVFLRGDKVNVIGVFKREGQNLIDFGLDNASMIPLNYARSRVDIRNEEMNPYIAVRAKEGVSNQALLDELTGIMRAQRRIPPREEDDFALNEAKLISNGFDQLIGVVNIAGGFIGFFSILVGGFGIANIMFVSVKERTNIIGIQKSLGAKNYFILFQFLFESMLLSMFGGIIGLLLIFLLTLALSGGLDFKIVLSGTNIMIGLIISGSIGLISGIAPAISAARLNPVDAIRSK
jgi:putative ABC transport system permease protein